MDQQDMGYDFSQSVNEPQRCSPLVVWGLDLGSLCAKRRTSHGGILEAALDLYIILVSYSGEIGMYRKV
jgi:hypothetical protein